MAGRATGPGRGAKGYKPGCLPLPIANQFEETVIFGAGAGPAPFDIVHAKFSHTLRDMLFVSGGKADARRLTSVAQGGIQQRDAAWILRTGRKGGALINNTSSEG